MTRDLTYATVPGLNRDLLCDLWEPDPDMDRSGLSIIYIHGGAWQSFDKDVMTRPFFRHLTAQGHVVMDIAYRLAGETDMCGMLGDVKRAIAWVKGNHATLGVDPARVVLSGGSAGAHLALLAAYTPNTSGFDPDDTLGCDTSACAVVAFYPVADLRTLTSYWSEQAMHPLATALGKVSGLLPEDGYLPWSRLARLLFGGPLAAVSQELLAYSPVAHVGSHCPPTLIIQGLHDHVIPVADVLSLHAALVGAGRPATLVPLPMVEHAFDMLPLRMSPPRQIALRAIDRFLASISSVNCYP
jgi:acetyl esterase/lipase